MTTYEELQDLLEQREAEVESFKEERRDKDAAISFLKTKIVTLQNQSKVHADARVQGTAEHPSSLETDVTIALQERDRHIADLESQLASARQETARGVHRMVSASATWQLEETKHRLADRDREVENLRRSLDWQERETKRIQECSSADLEELRQLFHVRDAEVAELKRSLEELSDKKREQHLEVELRRQAEQVRRLSSLGQHAEEEVGALKQQLREARDEIAWLWQKLREQGERQDEAGGQHTFFSDDLAEAFSPASPFQQGPPPIRMKSQGLPPGAEAAAGDIPVSTIPSLRVNGVPAGSQGTAAQPVSKRDNIEVAPVAGSTLRNAQQQPAEIPGQRFEWCQAADAGAGIARSFEDINVTKEAEKVEISTSQERKDLAPSDVVADAPPTEEIDIVEEGEVSIADEGCELKPLKVKDGGALFSINFFDEDEDMAAKEAKKQRVARQIERRRQAREAAVSAASTAGPGRTPSSGSGADPSVTRFSSEPCEDPEASPREDSAIDVDAYTPMQSEFMISLPTPSSADESEPLGALKLPMAAPKVWNPGGSISPRMASDPLQASSPYRGSPVLSARLESGVCFTPESTPTNGSEACGGKTATLHSRFEGLRDEMKRRRSKNSISGAASKAQQGSDPLEMAEAVIADAAAPSDPTQQSSSRQSSIVNATAVTAAVSTATSAASRVLIAGGVGSHPFGFMAAGGGVTTSSTSPLHSARLGAKSPGERIITTTSSSASAPPGGPVFDRLGSSSGSGSRSRGSPPLPGPLGSPTAQASACPYFLQFGSAPAAPASPSAASVSAPSAPMSPNRADQKDPLLSSLQALPSQTAPRHVPQRLRSMPLEPSSASRASGGGDLDRSRRGTLSLSARNVQIGTSANGLSGNQAGHCQSGGSARFASGSLEGQRPARPSIESANASTGGGESEQDALHEAVVRFCTQRPAGRYPLVRLSRGVYLYGNKKLVVAVHNDKLMVRIGGGFVHLESHLNDCDRAAPPASPTAMSIGVPGTASAPGQFDPAVRLGGVAAARESLRGLPRNSVLAGRRR